MELAMRSLNSFVFVDFLTLFYAFALTSQVNPPARAGYFPPDSD